MKYTLLLVFLLRVALGQREYDCLADGIPSIVINAGQGRGRPTKEFFLPLFSNCSDADTRTPAKFLTGSQASETICFAY
jgi:hypothetical protein